MFSGDGRIAVTTWFDEEAGLFPTLIYRTRDLKIIEVLGMRETLVADAVSFSGRYLAVRTNPDGLRYFQLYRYDRRTGEYLRLSVNADGEPANRGSVASDISADGRIVAFNSAASNLVPGDRRPGVLPSDNADAFVATIEAPEPPCPPWSCPPPPPR